MLAEPVTDAVAHHGEGPVWDDDGLLWVDMLRGDVLTLRSNGVERTHVGDVAACVVPRMSGGLAVATERGFTLLHGAVEHLPEIWSDPRVRMNDGGCDPQGRFYCGSMAYDATPGRGALYRLDADRSVHLVLKDVTISNGLGWSPDGTQVYYVDSPTRRIDVFDFADDTGTFSNRRALVNIPEEAGLPDGLTVDAEGGVWVALWDGGAVHRYTPAGALDAVVELPVTRATSCAFGGEDLTDLYITTSAMDVDEPGAGAVFSVRPGIKGLPTLRCAA